MCAVELAGAVADPEEVCGGVEVFRDPVRRIREEPREGLLVFEEEPLVRGVEVCGVDDRGGISADGMHEGEGVGDGVDDGLILRADLVGLDVREGPGEGVVEIGEAGRELGAEVV